MGRLVFFRVYSGKVVAGSVCVNDENETLVSIDIQDICRVYTSQQVKMTLNGECEGSL